MAITFWRKLCQYVTSTIRKNIVILDSKLVAELRFEFTRPLTFLPISGVHFYTQAASLLNPQFKHKLIHNFEVSMNFKTREVILGSIGCCTVVLDIRELNKYDLF